MITSEDPNLIEPEVTLPAAVQSQAVQTNVPTPEPNEHPSVFLDVLAAPFRGVEDAVRNTYNFADFLTADALPNYDKNFLGKSQTTAGNVVEGVSNFLTGFIPIAGWAGKAGQALGLAGKLGTVVKAAAAGAATDFLAFDGHEERLSNLVQKFPALANPVTEYLAADHNDGTVEARFKNALEGVGVGVLTDGMIHALKSMNVVRKAKVGTIAAEEAQKVVNGAVPSIEENLGKAGPKPKIPASVDIEAAPGLEDVANVVARYDWRSVEGGGLFQSPEKEISRVVDAPDDTVKLLGAVSQKLKEALGPATIETQGRFEGEVAQRLSDYSGMPAETILASFRAKSALMQDSVYHGEAAARLMVAAASEAQYYAKLASGELTGVAHGLTQEQLMLKSMKAQEVLAHLVSITKGFGTIEGRALRSRRFIKSAQIEAQNVARDMVEQFGGKDFLSPELRKLALAGTGGNPAEAAKGVSDLIRKQMSMGDRLMRAHNEYWINAVLSGTKTSAVNAIGNTMMTLIQPLEQAVGSAFQKDLNGVRASLKNYVYLAQHVQDSWKMASKAFIEGENQLIPSGAVNDLAKGPAIDASKLLKGGPATTGFASEAAGVAKGLTGRGDGNLLSHFINFTGETVRMPQRFLLSSDEFFKQLNYRAAAKTELYYRGLDKGLSGDALANYITDGFSRTVTEGGARYSEDAVIQAAYQQAEAKGLQGAERNKFIRDYRQQNWDPTKSALKEAFDVSNLAQSVADEATFTAPLGEMGKGVQRFAQSHPLFQLLVPFVRTPTNIIKEFSSRAFGSLTFMPGINKLQTRNLVELGSSDALVRSRAMGRIAVGQAAVSMAAIGALSGKLTGSGPKDPNERKLLEATGWQPYSIRVDTAEGPHYVSYQRLDPLATFLGLVADWSETAKRQDPWHTDLLSTTLTAMATAVSNNITNKTYLASLAQVIDAINQPDRKFMAFTRARVGSYVPSLIAQWNSSMDDGQTMREVRGFWDGALNRIPGAQGLLEPKRNILGESVDSPLAQTPLSWMNPITLSKDKGDAVFNELSQFGHGLQAPSPAYHGAINLLDDKYKMPNGRTAFDRWQELTGQVSVGGRTVRQQLERLISSPGYQRMAATSPGEGLDSPRLGQVKQVLETYRRAAYNQLQHENPALMQDMRYYQVAQADLRRGQKAAALEQVKNIIGN